MAIPGSGNRTLPAGVRHQAVFQNTVQREQQFPPGLMRQIPKVSHPAFAVSSSRDGTTGMYTPEEITDCA